MTHYTVHLEQIDESDPPIPFGDIPALLAALGFERGIESNDVDITHTYTFYVGPIFERPPDVKPFRIVMVNEGAQEEAGT